MELVIYSSLPALALLIFFVPGRVRVVVAGLATLAAGVFTSVPALSVLSGLPDACLAYQVRVDSVIEKIAVRNRLSGDHANRGLFDAC